MINSDIITQKINNHYYSHRLKILKMSHENGATSNPFPGQQTLLEDSFANSSSTEGSMSTTSIVSSDDSNAENYFGNGYPDEEDSRIRDLLNLSDKSCCGRNHHESDREFCVFCNSRES